MSIDSKLKVLFGIISTALFVSLLFKLPHFPGGMILSGLFLGGIILFRDILICLLISSFLRLVLKSYSFLTFFALVTTISFSIFHYKLYSPTLKIIVPNEFYGSIHLVRSNVEDNMLTVDSNGIGYLNEWTFSKTHTEPSVERANGEKITSELKWYNHSTFWGRNRSCCLHGKSIESLSFIILAENARENTWYDKRNLLERIDKKLVVLIENRRPK